MPKPLNGEFYTRADDELMMTTPSEWPRWPWLPLKRSGSGHLEAGAVFGGPEPDGSVEVWIVNVYDLPDSLAGQECRRYATPAEACDDGWRVD